MAQPRFRFLDTAAPESADAQFWRDAEASERLGSHFKANLFLRELCRTRAWEGAAVDTPDQAAREAREQALLAAAFARGYRVFGPDLDGLSRRPLANAG